MLDGYFTTRKLRKLESLNQNRFDHFHGLLKTRILLIHEIKKLTETCTAGINFYDISFMLRNSVTDGKWINI